MHSIEARIRKEKSNLILSGIAMILFGAWSIIRFIATRLFDKTEYDEVIAYLIGDKEGIDTRLVFIAVIIILLFDLLIRTYVGRSAIIEGRDIKRKNIIYVIVAALYLFLQISADISSIRTELNEYANFKHIIDNVIDLTINIATAEIVISAVKVRILNKKYMKNSEAEIGQINE